ncbi:MAG: hypothetical protein WBM86_16855 [Waterburya sp.]
MVGKASLEITANNNDVQISNFGDNSFQITNLGDKKIAQIDIDVTNALYPDSVFDPFGQAGDTTSKALNIDNNGSTGVIDRGKAAYIGVGGRSGYKGLQLKFNNNVDGGFEPGETIGFSVDMDPNSVAGSEKGPLDDGSSPSWDVGGVSGAELIGSTFTVTFTDGSTATGQLQGNNNQGGSKVLADQDSPDLDVSLTVNGLDEGSIGTYNSNGPSVIVNGPAGETARIVLTKGFIQPVISYASFLEDQLNALVGTDFPANNAVEFQTVDILLTGVDQDISDKFDFSGVPVYDFEGDDQLPIGFVASIIDADNDDFALGEVTAPIYLQFSETDTPIVINNDEPTDVVEEENIANTAATSIIIEAEDITDITGYRIENNSIASGNKLLSFVGGDQSEIGSASFDFSGVTGNYNIILGTYDENDGQATIQVAQEGNVIGSLLLNGDLGENAISANTKVAEVVAANILISEGDSFTITGFEDGGEHARFDYIEFELVGSSEPDPIVPIEEGTVDIPTTRIRFEAEDADIITNYRTESIFGASEGNVLSFLGDGNNETGSASFTFDELAGTYEVILATYDENDGVASFNVTLNGSQVSDLILDDDLGSNVANTQTAISQTIAFGVELSPGDVLTVNGFENANEHARFDYIEFVPLEI